MEQYGKKKLPGNTGDQNDPGPDDQIANYVLDGNENEEPGTDHWLNDDFVEEYATPESMQQQNSGLSEEKYENWTEISSDDAMDAWIQGSVPWKQHTHDHVL